MPRIVRTLLLPGLAAPLLAALPAAALQPLTTFVAGARARNPDVLEARANLGEAQAQAEAALGRQLPGLSARASYSRNQYETQLLLPGVPQPIELVPETQWDGAAALTVPLVDLASFERIRASRTGAEVGEHLLGATLLQTEAQAAQAYFQLVANLALVDAARTSLDVAEESLRFAESLLQAGTATSLDVDRAQAEVEQRTQQLASAQLQAALAARALESISGISPETSAGAELNDDLHAEPPLASFESGLHELPAVEAAAAGAEAARQAATAEKLVLLPSIAGSFAERGTTAPGFLRHDWTWQASIGASWSFDLTRTASIHRATAEADGAEARQMRTWLAARDAVHRQWHSVLAGIARSKSARAGLEAAQHAADTARKSYEAGSLAQLDLLQTQRDAFTAEVARIQADADLMNARAQLRLAAGQSLSDSPSQRRMQ